MASDGNSLVNISRPFVDIASIFVVDGSEAPGDEVKE
jgi:hypothetical protein